MKSHVLTLLLLLPATLGYAAANSSCTAGAGAPAQVVPVSSFDNIEAKGDDLALILTNAPQQQGVHILATDAVSTAAEIHVKNHTLIVKQRFGISGFLWPNDKPLKILIPVQGISELTINLSGNTHLYATNIVFDSLNIKVSDDAHAEVRAPLWLNALAIDHGEIWYYGMPAHLNQQAFDSARIIPQPLPSNIQWITRCS